MKTKYLSICMAAALTPSIAFSASTAQENETDIETIEVKTVRQKLGEAGRLKDVIQQTELIDEQMIQNKNALNLSEAINNEPGINVSNECSMCGVKRVMLNGMKGEHTTILVDGLPTHTLISGFYAVDAIATTGIDRIEVARGAGASLIAPEAIGGTINTVTKQAVDNGVSVDFSMGSHDLQTLGGAATAVSEDGKTGLTLIAQYHEQSQEDNDNNGVSESPYQQSQSVTALVSQDLGSSHNIQVRVSKVDAEIFGGPMIGSLTSSIGQTLATFDGADSEQLFENNDVRDQYIGKPWETAEWIKTERDEGYIKWLTELSSRTSSEYAISYAKHEQDSFYEGIDYIAEDEMWFARAKFDIELTDKHFISVGADIRHEEMRSDTEALRDLETFQSDAFDYTTQGVFIQDTWTPNDAVEIALAMRIDAIEADFIDPAKPGVEIDETFIAPRMDARYFHNENLTSRLSVGRGYRAPLSFFETDHGILDAELGYIVDIDALEESISASYSLNYEDETFAITGTLSGSSVENLASLEETDEGIPILTQLTEDATVITADISFGYNVTDNFSFNAAVEHFEYDEDFQSSYAIAPFEDRANIELEYQEDNWSLYGSTTWYGSRDLTEYGYEGFNIAGSPDSIKPTTADAFMVTNIRAEYAVTTAMSIYAGVSNLFDYTQVEDDDTPLFFDADGGYDVAYIYAPLNGREFYAGIELKL